MFCPKCGKRQMSDDVRFCTKCGLALENASMLLVTGGSSIASSSKRQLSPRAKGILQGIALIPGLFGAMLVLDIFYEAVFNAGMLGGLYATITLILLVALARIGYAVILEEGSQKSISGPSAPGPAQMHAGADTNALPARDELSAVGRRETGEMLEPRSVTENTTTRLRTIE